MITYKFIDSIDKEMRAVCEKIDRWITHGVVDITDCPPTKDYWEHLMLKLKSLFDLAVEKDTSSFFNVIRAYMKAATSSYATCVTLCSQDAEYARRLIEPVCRATGKAVTPVPTFASEAAMQAGLNQRGNKPMVNKNDNAVAPDAFDKAPDTPAPTSGSAFPESAAYPAFRSNIPIHELRASVDGIAARNKLDKKLCRDLDRLVLLRSGVSQSQVDLILPVITSAQETDKAVSDIIKDWRDNAMKEARKRAHIALPKLPPMTGVDCGDADGDCSKEYCVKLIPLTAEEFKTSDLLPFQPVVFGSTVSHNANGRLFGEWAGALSKKGGGFQEETITFKPFSGLPESCLAEFIKEQLRSMTNACGFDKKRLDGKKQMDEQFAPKKEKVRTLTEEEKKALTSVRASPGVLMNGTKAGRVTPGAAIAHTFLRKLNDAQKRKDVVGSFRTINDPCHNFTLYGVPRGLIGSSAGIVVNVKR